MSRKQSLIVGVGVNSVHLYTDNNGSRIVNVGTPINDNDATNKLYVDTRMSTANIIAGSGLDRVNNTLNVSNSLPFVTELGTINSSTWAANTIAVNYGGTGRTSFNSNKLVLGNGSNQLLTTDNLYYDANSFKINTNTSITSSLDSIGIGSGGALTVLGGTAISGDVFIGKNLYTSGAITVGNLVVNGSSTWPSINTTNLNCSNLTSSNFITTNITTSSLNSPNAILTNITCTNINNNYIHCTSITGSNLMISGISIFGTVNSTNLSTGNLSCINETINSLVLTSISGSTLKFTNSSINSIISNSISTNLFTSGSICVTGNSILNNINVINISSSNINSSNINTTNISSSNSIATNISSSNANITNITSVNLISSNFSSSNLNTSNINVNSITTTNIITTNVSSNNLSTNFASIGNVYSNNISTNTLYSTNISSSQLFSSTISSINISNTNLTNTNLINTNLTNTNLISSNISASNLLSNNLSSNSLSSVNIVGSNLSLGNLLVSNISSGSLNVNTSINCSSISSANLYISNLSKSFNLVSTNQSSTNIIASNITNSNLNCSNLKGISMTSNNCFINNNLSVPYISCTTITSSSLISSDINTSNIITSNITTNSLTVNELSSGSLLANLSTIGSLMIDSDINTNKIIISSNYSGSPNDLSFFTLLPNIFTDNSSTEGSSGPFWAPNFISSTTIAAENNITTEFTTSLYIQGSPIQGINQTLINKSGITIGYVQNNPGTNLNGQIILEREDGNWFGSIFTEYSTNRVVLANASLSGGAGIGLYSHDTTPIVLAHFPSKNDISPTDFVSFNDTTSFFSTQESFNATSGSIVVYGGLGVNHLFCTNSTLSNISTNQIYVDNLDGSNSLLINCNPNFTSGSYGFSQSDSDITISSFIGYSQGSFGTKSNHPFSIIVNDAPVANFDTTGILTVNNEIISSTSSGSYGMIHTDSIISLGSLIDYSSTGSFGTITNNDFSLVVNGNNYLTISTSGNINAPVLSLQITSDPSITSGNYGFIHSDTIIELSSFIGFDLGAFGTKSNHPFSITVNDTPVANFDTSGSMTVNNEIVSQTSTGNYGLIHTDSIVTLGSFINNSKGSFGTITNNDLSFFTNGTEQVIIDTSGNMHVNGGISKNFGSFDINHPLIDSELSNKRLVFSFIEGPQANLIYKGSVVLSNGQAQVNLDKDSVSNPICEMTQGTFVALCRNATYYLQNHTSFNRVKGIINGNILSITCEDNSSSDIIHWIVIAERNDPDIKKWNRTNSDGYLITEYNKTI